MIIIAGLGWHPGVIGIVAARVKEKYNRPVCVVAFDDKGIGKASCRSVSQVDLGSAIIAAKQAEILIAGGGHKMAAGFTVVESQLENVRAFICKHVENQLNGDSYAPTIKLDGVLPASALTLDLATKIQSLGLLGQAMPSRALYYRVLKLSAQLLWVKTMSAFLCKIRQVHKHKGHCFSRA